MTTNPKQPHPDPVEKRVGAKVKVVASKPGVMTVAKRPRRKSTATTAAGESELQRKFNEWTEKSGEKIEQCFDNHPRHILKEFPKVGKGDVEEAYLANRLWWWRKANAESGQSIFRREGWSQWTQLLLSLYQDHFEHSAYLYELRARFEQRYAWDFGHPWVYSSRQQRRMLDCLWPNPYPAKNWLPSDANQPEWVRLREFTVNLSLNDSVHIAEFVGELKRVRDLQGISAPTAGTGVRRKPIVWGTIELLDTRRYNLRTLNDSERSQVSKALKAYKLACREAGIQP